MATAVVINGTTYTLPGTGDVDWAVQLNALLVALAANNSPSLMHFGAASTPNDATAYFLRPGFNSALANTTEVQLYAPFTGRASRLYVRCTGAPATQGQAITIRKNGAPTILTAALAAGAFATQNGTTADNFSFVAGDLLSVSVQGTAGITVGAVNLVASFALTQQ